MTRTKSRASGNDKDALRKAAASSTPVRQGKGGKKGEASYEASLTRLNENLVKTIDREGLASFDGVTRREVVIPGRDEDLADQRAQYVAESERIAAEQSPGPGLRVSVSAKTGHVTLRYTRDAPKDDKGRSQAGRIAEVVRSPFRGSGGRFSDPHPTQRFYVPEVTDEAAFKASVRDRLEQDNWFRDPAGLSSGRQPLVDKAAEDAARRAGAL